MLGESRHGGCLGSRRVPSGARFLFTVIGAGDERAALGEPGTGTWEPSTWGTPREPWWRTHQHGMITGCTRLPA